MRIPAFVAALLFASAGIGAACSGSETSAGEDDDDDDRRADDSTAGPASKKKDAGGGEAASPIASCGATQPLPLWVSEDDGFPTRLHVPVEVDGKSGSFVFDMGSETTFVATPTGTPDPVADGGTVAVEGCATAYMGRPYTAERARGLPNLGTFGADQVLAADVARFDLTAGVLLRFLAADAGIEGWDATELERVGGSLLIRMKLDGAPVRLLVDTGSPDILWLGQAKKDGDVEKQTQDALGNLLTIYVGKVSAELSHKRVESVPVSRMPSFPYLEQRIASQFGGDVQGLLGVSALGRDFAFDSKKNILYRKR